MDNNNTFKFTFKMTQSLGKVIVDTRNTKLEGDGCVIELTTNDIKKAAYNILDSIYDDRGEFSEGFCPVCMGGKWGFVNILLERVVDTIYDKVNDGYYNYTKEGYSIVLRDGYKSYLKMLGEPYPRLIEGKYHEAWDIEHGIGVVRVNGKCGAFSATKEKLILPCEYDWINAFYTDIIAYNKEGKWGIANENGEIIIEPTFDEIRMSQYANERNIFFASIDDEKYIIQRDGTYCKQ